MLSVLTVGVVCLVLSACGRGEEPTVPNAATAAPQKVGPVVESKPRVETTLAELGSEVHDLSLAGKIAYGEDRYSRVSSPLQGRVVEVRAHLGEHVQAGSVFWCWTARKLTKPMRTTPRKSPSLATRHAPMSWR